MKLSPFVTSDQSKDHKWYFGASSHIQKKFMSSPPSWDRSTAFHLCPFRRMVRFRLSEGAAMTSRLAQWSKCTGRDMSSTWNKCREKRLWYICPCGHPPQQYGYLQGKADLGRGAKCGQVVKEKGKPRKK